MNTEAEASVYEAESVGENATHGSDSDENAAIEIAYFFSRLEIL